MNALKRALQSLIKSPGFSILAVVTLALGIGANTAMFTLLNAMVLRPLPFTNSEELVRIWRTNDHTQRSAFAPADFFDLRRGAGDAGRFGAFVQREVALSLSGSPPESMGMMSVSADFFDLLNVTPRLGRTFRSDEEMNGNHRIVLISEETWTTRFGGAEDIIGRTMRIDGEPHEIVGVLPSDATARRPLNRVGLVRPLGLTDAERASRTDRMLNILARRSASLSNEQFDAFVTGFGRRIAQDFPEANRNSGWRTESLVVSGTNANGRVMLMLLLGLSASVLLIACSNLANFLLARTMSRAREFAVRSALGATRWHLVVPLAWEALIIALTGGLGALLVSSWTAKWISVESGRGGSTPLDLPLDWRVLGFALAAALFTALFFGVVPALFAIRVDPNETLKSSTRSATASRGHQRLRSVLIVGQFALAMVILSAAGFFIRGAHNAIRQNFGWSIDDVVQGAIELPKGKYASSPQIVAFQRRAEERLRGLPGVDAVSFSHELPYTGLSAERGYIIERQDARQNGNEWMAESNAVAAEYFRATGTSLKQGRPFRETDDATSSRVAIVSDSFARTLFSGNAIGRRIARAGAATPEWMEIVGVVENVRSAQMYRTPSRLQVYLPLTQEPRAIMRFALRTHGVAPSIMISPIREVFAALDPDLPVTDLMTAENKLELIASEFDLVITLLSAFGALALSLAAIGIYGVIARTVTQRTVEFGIRMALGAEVGHVTALVLKTGTRLALTGACLGLAGAVALSLVLASALPSLRLDSPWVIAGGAVLLMAIALLASYLPARRASRINPVEALRAE